MSSITYVASRAELYAALQSATAGGEVRLAPGDYGVVDLNGYQPGAELTVRSANPDDPAMISFLYLRNSQNLTFRDLVFQKTVAPTQDAFDSLVRMDVNRNITIADSVFDGVRIAEGAPLAGMISGGGLFGLHNDNVVVSGNSFTEVHKAVSLAHSKGVVVSDNVVDVYREDGFFFGPIEDAVIERNIIVNPEVPAGNHPDFMSFGQLSDVVIRDNYLNQGAGDGTQGIAFGLGASPAGSDVLVANNIVVTTAVNAIFSSNVADVVITDNLVLSPRLDRAFATIRIEGAHSDGMTITRNLTDSFGSTDAYFAEIGAVLTDNLRVTRFHEDRPTYYGAVFENALNNRAPTLDDYALTPEFVALYGDQMGVDYDRFDFVRAWETAKIAATDAATAVNADNVAPVVETPDLTLNFADDAPRVYARRLQDRGVAEVLDDGATLAVRDNGWKAVDVAMRLTETSRMRLDIRVDELAEIHGVGFETDERPDEARFAQLFGSEIWGDQRARQGGDADGWRTVDLAIGAIVTGDVDRVVFVTDADTVGGGATLFRNVAFFDVDLLG